MPTGSAPAPYPTQPGNSTPPAKGWPPSNCAALSLPRTATGYGTTLSAPWSLGGSTSPPARHPPETPSNSRQPGHSGYQPHQDPFRCGKAGNDLLLEY